MIKLHTPSDLEEISSSYVLGVLATDEPFYPLIGQTQEVITPAKNSGGILFFVKAISTPPELIQELDGPIDNDFYIGFDNEDVGFLSVEYKYKNTPGKIEEIADSLKGKIILFNPKLKYDERYQRYHKNLTVFSIEDDYKPGTTYVPVPVIDMSNEEFEQQLLEGGPIEFNQYNHTMPSPKFIMCGNYLYTNFGEWKIHPRSKSSRILPSTKDVVKLKFVEEDYLDYLGAAVEYLNFIERDYIENLDQLFEVEGIPSSEWQKDNTQEPVTEQTKVSRNVENNLPATHSLELEFLNALEQVALESNLHYSRKDLINFHTSLKTNAINILSGQTGTGKTQLAYIYAKTLGLTQDDENPTLLVLPISPSYTEPGDILGYLNASTGLYTPAETGLVHFLKHAKDNPTQVHMLILDELNLGQVEHWFAPFISLLELDAEERKLRLYSKDSVCHNKAEYPSTIQIYDNILIVGSMNTDETTKEVSDRLLDRTNVITPKKMSFVKTQKRLNEKQEVDYHRDYEDVYGTMEAFGSWKSKMKAWDAFSENDLLFFDDLHEVINAVDPSKGFSFRNLVRMGDYLNNIPIEDGKALINREDAIDLFIKQRVLTKIRGPIEIYEELIGTMNPQEEQLLNSTLYSLFESEQARSVSHFEESKKVLRRKAKELLTNGYAS